MDEEKKIIKKVDKIDRAMAQEGMPLTQDEKNIIADIYQGKKTYKEARMEIIQGYKTYQETIKANSEIQNIESTKKHGR